ncbi:MAG: hypothetical protein J5688_04350 [Paludibacteraceae bacterium]|nr:hypothetical protein [Paludibacteraceae bacterium]
MFVHGIAQLELIHQVAHGAHVAVDASEDVVIVEPGERDDALDIRRMGAGYERLHGGYLIAALTEQVTVIITRACVIIRIDIPPLARRDVSLRQREAVVIQPALVHAHAVRRGKRLPRLMKSER